jgi:hypothetical protein
VSDKMNRIKNMELFMNNRKNVELFRSEYDRLNWDGVFVRTQRLHNGQCERCGKVLWKVNDEVSEWLFCASCWKVVEAKGGVE